MKMMVIIFLFFCELNAQENFSIGNYSVILFNSKLTVENKDHKLLYERSFSNPEIYSVDLDDDGIDELLVNDAKDEDDKNFYTMYIYSMTDSVALVDSIYSGLNEPYCKMSDETNGYIIISGSPDFDEFCSSQNEEIFSPVVCWKYEDGELSLVSDSLYEVYMNENETILQYIISKYANNGKTCETSKMLKDAIAAVYANYYHAGEKSNAESFLKNYYLCKDIEEFKNKIKELL
jgi:hypothetical protein